MSIEAAALKLLRAHARRKHTPDETAIIKLKVFSFSILLKKLNKHPNVISNLIIL